MLDNYSLEIDSYNGIILTALRYVEHSTNTMQGIANSTQKSEKNTNSNTASSKQKQ